MLDRSGCGFSLPAIIFALAALVAWAAADVLFLFFAGGLFAIALRAVSNFLKTRSGLGDGWALAITLLSMAGLVLCIFWIAFPFVTQQAYDLQRELPAALDNAVQKIGRYDLGESAVDTAERMQRDFSIRNDLLPRIFGFASTLAGGLAASFIVFFSGIYLAISPASYRRGAALLFPKRYESTIEDLLLDIGDTLQWWLLGKLLSMLAVGVLSWLGLWWLGVPLAAILALLAAVLTFVPNIGPVIAAIPAILLAFTKSANTALYVLLLALLVQGIETYALSPYLQKRTVSLAPALTLFVQVVMGILFGGIAVMVATPLAAAGLVTVENLWINGKREKCRPHAP